VLTLLLTTIVACVLAGGKLNAEFTKQIWLSQGFASPRGFIARCGKSSVWIEESLLPVDSTYV
jgi:hypothetical protein